MLDDNDKVSVKYLLNNSNQVRLAPEHKSPFALPLHPPCPGAQESGPPPSSSSSMSSSSMLLMATRGRRILRRRPSPPATPSSSSFFSAARADGSGRAVSSGRRGSVVDIVDGRSTHGGPLRLARIRPRSPAEHDAQPLIS